MLSMAERQGATPPPWRERGRLPLLADVVGGLRRNFEKLRQTLAVLLAYFRPGLIERRLRRLHELGHIDTMPTLAQLLVAGRDQMMLTASEETKVFYASQGIPWVFHNLRRFISNPATMMDPIGLFSPRDTIVEHVLQTFHRHPLYDLVLLRAHEGGVEEMRRQAEQLASGTHLNQRALTSSIEDGAYHARLPGDVAAFESDPMAEARPVPPDLLDDPLMVAAMDQFKDMRGLGRYACRLRVSTRHALAAWAGVAFNETVGQILGRKVGPSRPRIEACDEAIARRYGAS